MIDSNYDVYHTESSTDKENNKNCANPAEMKYKTRSLTLKHEGIHFEQLVDALMPVLDENWHDNHSYNVFNNVDEGQKYVWYRICLQH